MSRCQESVSFMIIIGLVISIFIIFSGVINKYLSTAVNTQFLLKVRSVNERLASAIYRSFINGPGSVERVVLEQVNDNYTILVRPGNVIAVYDSGSITNPTYAFRVFDVNVSHGVVTVINEGGVINVSQV